MPSILWLGDKVTRGAEEEGGITLLSDVGFRSRTVGCWEFGVDLSSPCADFRASHCYVSRPVEQASVLSGVLGRVYMGETKQP
jgi:hypothetical protein